VHGLLSILAFKKSTLDPTLLPMNQIDLSGRNAVVTGGARGIGYAI